MDPKDYRQQRCAHGWVDVTQCKACATEAENEALRAFAKAVMECWPMGDLDGGTLQEIAEKHGMLKPETRYEPCGEVCSCREYADAQEWAGGLVCYRKTALLMGPIATHDSAQGQEVRLDQKHSAQCAGGDSTGNVLEVLPAPAVEPFAPTADPA